MSDALNDIETLQADLQDADQAGGRMPKRKIKPERLHFANSAVRDRFNENIRRSRRVMKSA
jgi:hypothetical protein